MKIIPHLLLLVSSLIVNFSLLAVQTDGEIQKDSEAISINSRKDLGPAQSSEQEKKEDAKPPKKMKERLKYLAKGLGWSSLNVACAVAIYWLSTCELSTDKVKRERQALEKNNENPDDGDLYSQRLQKTSLEEKFNKPLIYTAALVLDASIIIANTKYKMISKAWHNLKQAFS